MNDILYDLKDNLKKIQTGKEYLHALLDQYKEAKKHSNSVTVNNQLMYIIGAIDAIYYAKMITREDYTLFYKYFGL
jgi:succinate dehydrogenase/fumarate reductase flavoprotein subunit